MEVRVDTFVESLEGSRQLIKRAYLVMVALNDGEQSVEVPRLLLKTEDEQ